MKRTAVGYTLIATLVLLFLVAPVLVVIPMSFGTSGVFELFPANPGLALYRRFFESAEWILSNRETLWR